MHVFHLSARGRDTAPGTERRPWATLAGARDNLQKLRATGAVLARGKRATVMGGCIDPGHGSANFFGNILVGPSAALYRNGYQGIIARGALFANAICV